MNPDQTKWDRIYSAAPAGIPEVARVLAENIHLLPSAGRALDMACGLGGNALALTRHGLDTWAYDISPVAIDRLGHLAESLGLAIHAEARDLSIQPPESATFDVIVVSRFLDRDLTPQLVAALKPGGLLFYQTYTVDKLTPGGPSNPAYLLGPRELLSLFAALDLVVYREDARLGDVSQGCRDEALFIGRKP